MPTPSEIPREEATPQGTLIDGVEQIYDSDFWKRAAVDYNATTKKVTTQVMSSGTAASVLSFHVKATNNAATARDYFIEFKVPAGSWGATSAYSIVPGDNGGTYLFHTQNSAFSRSLVDVWWTACPSGRRAGLQLPGGLRRTALAEDRHRLGQTTQSDRVRLYLGKLAAARPSRSTTRSAPTCAPTPPRAARRATRTRPADRGFHCFELQSHRLLPPAGAARSTSRFTPSERLS